MIKITKEHFLMLNEALNKRVGSNLFEVFGDPDDDQEEMFGYINNWVIADGKFRARLSAKDNAIIIPFSDLNYFSKLNLKESEILTPKESIVDVINMNTSIFSDNTWEVEEDNITNIISIRTHYIQITPRLFFDLNDNKLYYNYVITIHRMEYPEYPAYYRLHNNIEDVKNQIDLYFQKYFYKNIVDKKSIDLSEEEKKLIRLYYYG